MNAGAGQVQAMTEKLETLTAEVSALREAVEQLTASEFLYRVFFDAGVNTARRGTGRQARPRRERPGHLRMVSGGGQR